MTGTEFQKWLEFHQQLFPEVTVWLSESDRKSEVILKAWFEVLKRIAADDARRCTMQMLAGELDHPNRFEVSRLPAAILAACPKQLISGEELKRKTYNPHTGELV